MQVQDHSLPHLSIPIEIHEVSDYSQSSETKQPDQSTKQPQSLRVSNSSLYTLDATSTQRSKSTSISSTSSKMEEQCDTPFSYDQINDAPCSQSPTLDAKANIQHASPNDIQSSNKNADLNTESNPAVVIAFPKAVEAQVGSVEDTPAEKSCRFCFETEESPEKGNLICPCRCDGTLKYIHNSCLKTWLAQKEARESLCVKCEICAAAYRLESQTKLIFHPSRACEEGLPNLLYSMGLMVCIFNIVWLVEKCLALDLTKVKNNSEGAVKVETIDKIMIICCGFLGFTFVVSMVLNLKNAFFERRMTVSKIFDYDPVYQQQIQELEEAEAAKAKNQNSFYEFDDKEETNCEERMQEMQTIMQEPQSPGLSLDVTMNRLINPDRSIAN